jgi:hypothetical protein
MTICKCTHSLNQHDSGGCCRVNFCPCSRVELCKKAEPQKESDRFLDFDIQSASFADLARWAYKAQDEIRRLKPPIPPAPHTGAEAGAEG